MKKSIQQTLWNILGLIAGGIVGLLFAFFIFGCNPAKRINNITKRHPELLKTQKDIVKDTMEIPALVSEGSVTPQIDQMKYDSLLGEFVNLSATTEMLLGKGVELENQVEIEKAKQRIKKEIIKAVIPDTVFNIKHPQIILVEDKPYQVNLTLKIHLSSKGIEYFYRQAPITIPYVREEVNQNIDARVGTPFWKDKWFWLFLLTLVVLFRKQIMSLIVRIPLPTNFPNKPF